jgi:hypothetical protein
VKEPPSSDESDDDNDSMTQSDNGGDEYCGNAHQDDEGTRFVICNCVVEPQISIWGLSLRVKFCIVSYVPYFGSIFGFWIDYR